MRLPLGLVRAAVAVGSRPMGRPVPIGVQRAWLEATSVLNRLPSGTTVTRGRLGARPAEQVRGPEVAPDRAVLLLHGGAFITGSARTHRGFAAHLAHATGATVHVLDYRRAPEHPHPGAVEDADAALEELEATGAGPVAVVGDSAGGALALLLAQARRDGQRPLPAALGLVSPVADLTLADSLAYTGPDPLLRRSWIRMGRDAFVGHGDPRALSPLHQPLHALPPVLLHLSGDERLRPEGERLAAGLRAAGVDVDLELLAGMWHDVHLHAALVPEAAEAVVRMGAWLKEKAWR
jgi:epsilon-lactone hydrolase